jgi:hypothetical protein
MSAKTLALVGLGVVAVGGGVAVVASGGSGDGSGGGGNSFTGTFVLEETLYGGTYWEKETLELNQSGRSITGTYTTEVYYRWDDGEECYQRMADGPASVTGTIDATGISGRMSIAPFTWFDTCDLDYWDEGGDDSTVSLLENGNLSYLGWEWIRQ